MALTTIAFEPGSSLQGLLLNASHSRVPAVITGVQLSPGMLSGNISCEGMPWRGQAFLQTKSRKFFHEKRGKPLRWVELARRQRLSASCADLRTTPPFLFASEDITSALPSEVAAMLTIPEVSTQPASLNVWMGGHGVVSAAHYDFHSNSYLQLAGTKAWTLAPPSEALRLRLFPAAHPRDRQSQAGLRIRRGAAAASSIDEDTCDGDDLGGDGHASDTADDESPAASSTSAEPWPAATASYHVVLRPGDLLYLPPLYMHRVEAAPRRGSAGGDGGGDGGIGSSGDGGVDGGDGGSETLSISLNVFSESWENLAEKEMVEAQLPPAVMGMSSAEGGDGGGGGGSDRSATAAVASKEAVPPALRVQMLAAFFRLVIYQSMRGGNNGTTGEATAGDAPSTTDNADGDEVTSDEATSARAVAHASEFLLPQLSSRWSPLYASLSCDAFDASSCPRARQAMPSALQREAAQHAARVVGALRRRTAHLEATQGKAEATAARALLVVRYVEQMAAHFLEGKSQALCKFLRCLATEAAWTLNP